MHGLQTIRRMSAPEAFRFGVKERAADTALPKRIQHFALVCEGAWFGVLRAPDTAVEVTGPAMASQHEAVLWCARQANEWGYRI